MRNRVLGWSAVGLALASILACAGTNEPDIPTTDIVSTIPWGAPESLRYRITDGDDLVGYGELRIKVSGSQLLLEQAFMDEKAKFRDSVTAVVDASSLKPVSVERVISGPEGERRCRADYGAESVQVSQSSEDDSRTDRLELPAHSYDSATDLFLWRTIDFVRGTTIAYQDVGTCNILSKPDYTEARLEVITQERVRVPAGSFDTWRLELSSGGRKQKIWVATAEPRQLIRYDNGGQLFELESAQVAP